MSVEVVTFGCRLNVNESEALRTAAEGAGMNNAIVVNTCAVTNEAVRQARQTIRRLRREAPAARIVVTGCAAQTDPLAFANMPEVDRVMGNHDKLVPSAWHAARGALGDGLSLEAEEKVAVSDIMAVREMAPHLVEGFSGLERAFVQVQNGCDHRCTFCIIPFGRGPSRSVAMGAVVDQVRQLVEKNYAEIVLTGVDLTSYGADLPGAPRLGALVKTILRHVPELKRLRVSSIDSIEADRDLIDAIANEERLMPHLHLSLQAGDDMILKRMKRRHLRADAVAFCRDMVRLRPGLVLGADLIAGFPTETEEMFARTLDLVGECELSFVHAFPFSPRPGTPAARMPQVAGAIIKDRARRLRAAGGKVLRDTLDRAVGEMRQVLIEGRDLGRTEDFLPVKLRAAYPRGSVVALRMAAREEAQLVA